MNQQIKDRIKTITEGWAKHDEWENRGVKYRDLAEFNANKFQLAEETRKLFQEIVRELGTE